MQPPAGHVMVSVGLLSGRKVQVVMEISGSVAQLQKKVEEELGVGQFEEVRLSAGKEPLRQDLPVVQLTPQCRGQGFAAQAVVVPSVANANAFLRSYAYTSVKNEYLRERLGVLRGKPHAAVNFALGQVIYLSKCNEAFQLLVDARDEECTKGWFPRRHIEHVLGVPNVEYLCFGRWLLFEQPVLQPFWRYATFEVFFSCAHLESGHWRFRDLFCVASLFSALFRSMAEGQEPRVAWLHLHELFNEPVIAAIETPEYRTAIIQAWVEHGRGRAAWDEEVRDAFDWLAHRHPQAAVRRVASDAIRKGSAPLPEPSTAGVEAAHPCQPREGAAAAVAGADPLADASDEQEVEEIAQAVDRSNVEALEREGQEVSEALLRSKADRWSADGVILARLSFHTPELLQRLRSSSLLAPSLARVAEAGCEPCPAWAGGALLLVPATEEQIAEAGIQLKALHILMLSEDKPLVEQVLSGVPRRKRPSVQPERYAEGKGPAEGRSAAKSGKSPEEAAQTGREPAEDLGTSSKETAAAASRAADEPNDAPLNFGDGLVVERTFLHFPIGKDVSAASEALESAPACPGKEPGSPNPHRWPLRAGEP